jgi:uncharacterized protein (TIGR02145 family)
VTFQVEILTIYFLKKESFNQGISFIYQPNGTAIIKCDLSTEGSDPNIQIDIEAFKKNFPNFFNPVTIFKLSKKDGSDCFFEEKINLYTKFNFADIIYKNGKPYFFYSHTNSDILFISGNSFFIAKIEYDSEIITFRLNANEQISYGNVYYGFIDLTQLSKNFPATAVDKYGKIPLDAKMHLTIFDLNGTKVYEHFDFSNYSKLEMNGQSDTIVLLNSIRKLWTRENIYIDNLPNEKIDTFYGTRMTFDQAFSKGGQSRPEGNCPDGYHIPTLEEWYTILDKYWNKIFDENNISEIKRNTSGLSFKQLGIDMLADNSLSSDKESNGSITTYWVAAPESGESGKEVQKVVIANNNQKVSIEEIPKKNNHRAYCRCIQD